MEFIIGLRQHKLFGYTLTAYWIENQPENNFYKVVQNILPQDVKASPDKFTDAQKEIVRLIDELSEKRIYKKFLKVRNTSITDFYDNIDKKYLEDFIFPYVGERLNRIFKIAHWENIKIFLKSYRYNKVFVEDQLFYVFEELEPVFYFDLDNDELRYTLKIFHRGKALNLRDKEIEVISNNPCIFLQDNRIFHIDNLNCKKLQPFFDKDFIIVRTNINKYFEGFVKRLIADYRVVAKGFDIEEIHPQKYALLSLEKFVNKKWGLALYFYYDGYKFKPSDKTKVYVSLDKVKDRYVFRKLCRDLSWEENTIYALKQSGLRPTAMDGVYSPPMEETDPERQLHNIILWLNNNAGLLEDLQIKVKQKTDKEYFVDRVNLELRVEKKIDWFDIYATVRFGDVEIPFLDLKNYILEGKREIELPNGQVAVIPDKWFARYKNILLFARKDKDKKRLKLAKTHFTVLEDLDVPEIKRSDIFKLIESFKAKQWVVPEVPSCIKAKLRNYQKKGYAWIYHLAKNNFGGCLADDMGLGKTIQTITAIAKAMEEERKRHNAQHGQQALQTSLFKNNGKGITNLVVVPKSLIHNWINEFRKFAPDMSLINYSGTNRVKLRDKLLNYDIVLTSYGIARNDIDFLSQIDFFFIVLDESQYIKNPQSKVYQAVRKLKGRHRLILTGTPIENSLSDLWTQMSFVNPGLLGSYNFFKRNFITPIEKNNDTRSKNELKRLIMPFILRRTKHEVVKDLPQLIEQTVYCEMHEEQALLYEMEKSRVRNEILKVYEQGKLKESSIYVLRALMRLRQIANHPRIIDGNYQGPSGKFDMVIDKIETVLQEGHKLLMFSSFVRHLELFREYFEQQGWPYVMLTGESENREEIIRTFQEQQDVRLFLISLKAGGVGLNLTAADYVFILDPWWNPAAEQQAISRAHRIGQENPVIVYRFISLGTVEEKIRLLQEKKRELFTEFVESANIFAQLSEDTVVELFS